MAKQKATKVPVTRVRQMADSLMDNSKKLKQFARPQIAIAEATKKNKVYDKQIGVSTSNPSTWGQTLSGRDRYNRGMQALKQASADSTKAVRFRSLADKATAGRDMPLPSSEGIIEKIKNFFD